MLSCYLDLKEIKMSRGKTISIVIPDSLKNELQRAADKLSIPRSRYIANILLNWKEQRHIIKVYKICDHLQNGKYCDFFKTQCDYLLSEQSSCHGYYPKESV